MPYKVDDENLPANVMKMPMPQKEKWVGAFNGAHADCLEKNGEDCEATAMKVANGMKEWISKELHSRGAVSTFKQRDGKYRWIGFTSNSYRDREKEIISTKALENAVAQMTERGDYGVLRWWHVGEPDVVTRTRGKGLDIASCDFSAVHNHVLVESGIYFDNQIGKAFAETKEALGMSPGFFHPTNQPNAEGVYEEIEIFERSLLPAERAANGLAAIQVKEEQQMFTDKLKALAGIVGGKQAEAVLSQAETIEAKAKEQGIEFKEVETLTLEQVTAAIAEAVKPLTEKILAFEQTQVSATKELGSTTLKALEEMVGEYGKLEIRLKSLESIQPRAASKDEGTILSKEQETKLKEKGQLPTEDTGLAAFAAFVTGHSVQPAA